MSALMEVPLEERRVVLMAFDNSSNAREAFEWMEKYILRPGKDHLVLLSVVQDDGAGFLDSFLLKSVTLESYGEQEQKAFLKTAGERAEEILRELSHSLANNSITVQRVIIRNTDPKSTICDTAKDTNASLIVLGSRGLSTLKRVLIGSVSEYVVNNAECPVLVVKPTSQSQSQPQSQPQPLLQE
ncbi:hypothetical protein BDF22DRAFT_696874 [Syncephalis plumigaleata]|nr:hypothetical protein BDF22DRAFT_696874 [Syncephalis plumigaleata]